MAAFLTLKAHWSDTLTVKQLEIIINNDVLLFSATNEETPYEQFLHSLTKETTEDEVQSELFTFLLAPNIREIMSHYNFKFSINSAISILSIYMYILIHRSLIMLLASLSLDIGKWTRIALPIWDSPKRFVTGVFNFNAEINLETRIWLSCNFDSVSELWRAAFCNPPPPAFHTIRQLPYKRISKRISRKRKMLHRHLKIKLQQYLIEVVKLDNLPLCSTIRSLYVKM